MDPEFWHARWENDEIGFHQSEINVHLQNYWPELGLPAGAPVFVPLCGKSRDLLWLRSAGHPVLGVEISPLAVAALYAETGVPSTRTEQGAFTRWEYDRLTVLCGDFFALTAADLDGIAAVYDRASLIALPPEMRTRYAAHMATILPPGAVVLLVTFEYPQEQMQGPPFAVTEDEVRRLYAGSFEVTCLHTLDILAENARFRERGLTRLEEKVFRLIRRP